MSIYKYDSTQDELTPISGSTVYADNPIGSIVPYGGATAPSGWLLCQGQAISRTIYAELFAVIGTAYGSGDGSTTFNLPDLRETVPVGVDENDTQTIASHDVYTLGQFKDDQVQANNKVTFVPSVYNWAVSAEGTSAFGGGNASLRIGNTTHGKQLGVNYIIKAKMVAVPADFMDAVEGAVADLRTVSTMTVTKQGNYINGTNFHGVKVGKVATIEINGDTGASIPWEQITTVGVAIGSATPLIELKCTSDMVSVVTGYNPNGNAITKWISPYCRAWIGAEGNIQVFLANPGTADTSYTGNLFIGGSYITQ